MSDRAATIVDLAALQRGVNQFHLHPEDAARAAIAARLGEAGLEALAGDFALTPFGGGVALDLHLTARVNRICVASLEPMIEAIDERYAIRFERCFDDDESADADSVLREPLDGDTLDLDELLVQHLALSLAPHPRKEGARSLGEGYRDPVIPSPFASLKGLVDGDA